MRLFIYDTIRGRGPSAEYTIQYVRGRPLPARAAQSRGGVAGWASGVWLWGVSAAVKDNAPTHQPDEKVLFRNVRRRAEDARKLVIRLATFPPVTLWRSGAFTQLLRKRSEMSSVFSGCVFTLSRAKSVVAPNCETTLSILGVSTQLCDDARESRASMVQSVQRRS